MGEDEFDEEFGEEVKIEEHIHYLKLLQTNSSIMQPEIRDAIEYAFKTLSNLKKEE